ncbi:MAG: PDZ domain-containing protein [Bacteroidales bacterium]|nr:PDZ domain-containing protein [Bacteroidales bacterium]
MKDEKLLVGFIYKNSPASKSKINVGDQIISINGIDYTNISKQQYCDILTNNVQWKKDKVIEIKWRNIEGVFKTHNFNNVDLFIY